MADRSNDFDVCVIGSGFGGGMAAKTFVDAGYRVAVVERGSWVERGPHNWAPDQTGDATEYYNRESEYRVVEGGNSPYMAAYHCVGGPSVFYGAVSLRFRETDFTPPAEIIGDSQAQWPIAYDALEPYYHRAEATLDIAGNAGTDPYEPPRSAPYPQAAAPVSDISNAIAGAGETLGLRPFQLPLAINYRPGERQCQLCSTCDTYACAVSAKNDISTVVMPSLQRAGMRLFSNTVAVRLLQRGQAIAAVECRDRQTHETFEIRAKWFVLAAGALATPLLIFNSGLQHVSPAADHIGRYLMRHINAIVFGLFPRLPGRLDTFHKQIGFHDYYFGAADDDRGFAKLGAIQQIHSPPVALVKMHLPAGIGSLVAPLAKRMTGLLAIAEDQPQYDNYVRLSDEIRDEFGLPQLEIRHRYSERDQAAVKVLAKRAKRILRQTGARIFYTHHIRTFSHAVGTVRMGNDSATAPVDAQGCFRGVDNLSITDGSVFPTAAAVNPSLTISALAIRAADYAIQQMQNEQKREE